MIVFCICMSDHMHYVYEYLPQLVEKLLVMNFDSSCGFLFTTSVIMMVSRYREKQTGINRWKE